MATTELNGKRRAWLSAQREHAAGLLGAIITASPVFGWHDRTIGTQVSTVEGERWLRVVAETSLGWWSLLDREPRRVRDQRGSPNRGCSPTLTGPTATGGSGPNS